MALINVGNDPWLSEYELCERLSTEILELLSSRCKESTNSKSYSRISASVRLRLKQFNNELVQLTKKLNAESGTLTSEEIERRSRLIEQLRSKEIQMQKSFVDNHDNFNNERRSLIDNTDQFGSSSGSDAPILNKESVMQDHERGLEELSKIISRQKQIANTINVEVDLHNDIIDDIGEHIDQTDIRVRSQTNTIKVLDKKDSTCGYWIVIILLFVAITTVMIV